MSTPFNETVQAEVMVATASIDNCPILSVQDYINKNNSFWLSDETGGIVSDLTVNNLTITQSLNANVEAGISTINTFGITVLGSPGKVDANLGDFNAVSTTNLQVFQDISCGGVAYLPLIVSDTIGAQEIISGTFVSTLDLVAVEGFVSSIYSSTITNATALGTSSITAASARFTSTMQLGDSALWTTDTDANPTGNTYNFLKLNFGTLSFAKGYGSIGIAPGDPDVNDAGPLFLNTSKRTGSAPESIDYVRTSKFWSESPSTVISPGGFADFALEVEGIVTVYAASTTGYGAFRVISVGSFPTFTTYVLTDSASGFSIAGSGTAGAGNFRISNASASVGTVFWHQMSAPGYE